MNGSGKTGAWGVAAVAAQASSAGFDEIDDLGVATGNRVSPVARRLDLAGVYERRGFAAGASVGTAGESYGGQAGSGPHGMQVTAGLLADFDRWTAGAALQLRGLGSGPEAGIPDVASLGGSVNTGGVWLNGNLSVPFNGPAGPDAIAGLRWPVTGTFDLRASYRMSFAAGVAATLGSSARLGLSLRSTGLGMDYALVVPLSSGLGVTHLIAVGWTWEVRRAPLPAR
jgi:hypothetical protein